MTRIQPAASIVVSSLRPPRLLRLLRLGAGVGVDAMGIVVGLAMGSMTIADGRDPSCECLRRSSLDSALQLFVSSSSSKPSRQGALHLSNSEGVGVSGIGVGGVGVGGLGLGFAMGVSSANV